MLNLILAVFLHQAGALAPIPAAPTDHLPITAGQDNYACDQIGAKLQAYNQMARSQDASVTSFLGQVSDKISAWYAELQPLEGATQTLPEGTFQPLNDGSTQISNITNLAYDNTGLLAGEMDHILASLNECNVTAREKVTSPARRH